MKIDKLEELNQALINRDKIKDDAIAQLSDQVMTLRARMQEFERNKIHIEYEFTTIATYRTEYNASLAT